MFVGGIRWGVYLGFNHGPVLKDEESDFVAKIGFLFPGQGSQIIGMGKDFFDSFPFAREVYSKAEKVLNFDLSEISFSGPEEKIKQTQYTQPVLYVHSYIVVRLLEERGIVADFSAGHSLGEFSALAYGDAFSFEDGLEMVRERALLMQRAGDREPGTMAAIIGLKAEEVMDICIEAGEIGIVQPANYNSPVQVVISGSFQGVNAAMDLAREKGAKRVVELPVSGAFHSQLMSSAVEDFGVVVDKISIRMPRIPVFANVTAVPFSNPDEVRMLLKYQLTHPVRWVETIQHMIEKGVEKFIEVGSGKVLSGLVKRISRDVETQPCGTFDEMERLKQDEVSGESL
jgi:[acyl-carrier-protein] S-malonyltransferase